MNISIAHQVKDGGQIDGGIRRHFSGALFKAPQRLRRLGHVLLAQVKHSLVDLQIVGQVIVARLFNRLDAP